MRTKAEIKRERDELDTKLIALKASVYKNEELIKKQKDYENFLDKLQKGIAGEEKN